MKFFEISPFHKNQVGGYLKCHCGKITQKMVSLFEWSNWVFFFHNHNLVTCLGSYIHVDLVMPVSRRSLKFSHKPEMLNLQIRNILLILCANLLINNSVISAVFHNKTTSNLENIT